MKKAVILLITCWVSIFSFAQKTNFSGNWVLDKNKSKLDEKTAAMIKSQTITVVQTEKEIKISYVSEQDFVDGQRKTDIASTDPTIYTFDGKETVSSSISAIGQVQAFCSGEIIDRKLKLKTVRVFNVASAVRVTTNETWELSENDSVLLIHRKVETPNGDISSELVFRKN
jgi:hypothetical protein